MNAVEWIKLKSGASSVGGKILLVETEASALTLENILQCARCLLTLSGHMTTQQFSS